MQARALQQRMQLMGRLAAYNPSQVVALWLAVADTVRKPADCLRSRPRPLFGGLLSEHTRQDDDQNRCR